MWGHTRKLLIVKMTIENFSDRYSNAKPYHRSSSHIVKVSLDDFNFNKKNENLKFKIDIEN